MCIFVELILMELQIGVCFSEISVATHTLEKDASARHSNGILDIDTVSSPSADRWCV